MGAFPHLLIGSAEKDRAADMDARIIETIAYRFPGPFRPQGSRALQSRPSAAGIPSSKDSDEHCPVL